MKQHRFILLLVLLVVTRSIFAQNNITVSGVVTDASDKKPLIGVSIYDKNNKATGLITDINGHYAINVPDKTTLVFSYIGYATQEISVQGRTEINVSLSSDIKELDEVVIVGVAMKKSDLTGSVVSVSSERLKEVPTSSVVEAMQGKAPGIFVESNPAPGSKASIKIRGNNSIQYGTNPIFVVDGLIIDGGFEMLNPDDIASIDVLKDASATAIYGSRGANGVVVVTTKKGKSGVRKVTYDTWMGQQEFSNTMPLMNGSETYNLRVDAYANAYIDKNPTADRAHYIEKSLTNTNPLKNLIFSKEELDSYANGKNYDWLSQITRKGFEQNHAVSFSGGDDYGTYYLSINYNDQKGQIEKAGFKRISGKINVDQKIKSWLKVGSSNTVANTTEHPVVNDNMFMTALKACPLLPYSNDYWYMREGKADNQSATNPLRDLTITKDNYTTRILSSNYLNISPVKDLDIRSTYSLDLMQDENYSYYPTTSTQSYSAALDGQSVQVKHKNQNWQWDNSINFNKIFAVKHKVSLVLGTNLSFYSGNWNQQNANGYNNDLFTYKYSQGASDKENFYLGSDFSSYSIQSYLMRANYSYDSRYNITLTGRSDGSSKFGSSNKWGLFPSVAGSWDIVNESFMKQQKTISTLRLRAGYGIAGNQNIPNYGYFTLYNPNLSLGSNILINGGRYGNPNLRWEMQKQVNLGLNAGFFKDRINFSVDLFRIENEDLLMERSTAPSSGYTSQLDNVGALENKGIEFSLNVAAIATEDFKWDVSFNLSADRNKITKLYGGVTEIYKLGGYSNNEIQREGNLFVGESLNNIYVYKFDKIAQESDMDYVKSLQLGSRVVRPGDVLPLDRDHNGIINDQDRYVVGKKDPDYYGGFLTTMSYKGIVLNVNTRYSVGAHRISYLYESLMGSIGNSAAHKDLLNRWTPENTNTNIPRAFSEGGRYSLSEVDWAVQNASFFKVSEITLSYSFPKRWMQSVRMENVRIYVTGNNLLTLTRYKGFDPESGDWYPSYRMYVAGLNISF
jgi:TonB-dependent starch-binding outer membrane protein SusC